VSKSNLEIKRELVELFKIQFGDDWLMVEEDILNVLNNYYVFSPVHNPEPLEKLWSNAFDERWDEQIVVQRAKVFIDNNKELLDALAESDKTSPIQNPKLTKQQEFFIKSCLDFMEENKKKSVQKKCGCGEPLIDYYNKRTGFCGRCGGAL
jgi:hypothetical protein